MPTHTLAATAAVAAVLALLCSGSAAQPQQEQPELAEKAVKMEELPKAVADALKKELKNNQAEEIEAIVYEGTIVLYEAEYTRDGREVEIVIRPWGELVPADQQQAEDDDPDEEGEDDDNGAQPAAGAEDDAVQERNVEMAALPKAVSDVFKKQLGEGPFEEVEEISYEGIVILYEAESDKGEMAVFPNGQVAQELKKDDEDEDDDEDDEPKEGRSAS